jgi:hypothetical protein
LPARVAILLAGFCPLGVNCHPLPRHLVFSQDGKDFCRCDLMLVDVRFITSSISSLLTFQNTHLNDLPSNRIRNHPDQRVWVGTRIVVDIFSKFCLRFGPIGVWTAVALQAASRTLVASRDEGLREDCETVSSRLLHDCSKARRLNGNCWSEFMSARLLPKRALTPVGG